MFTFIADEEIRPGELVVIDLQTGKASRLDHEKAHGDLLGHAARPIAKGEVIEVRPDGNTKDVIRKASVVTK